MEYLYNEHYKIVMKEIQEDTNGKISCVPGLEEYCLNVYTTQSNLQISWNLYQIPLTFFKEMGKNPKLYKEPQKMLNSHSNVE